MIEKLLEPFGFTFGKKQDLLTLLVSLRDNKINMNELINYLTDLKKERLKITAEQNNRINQIKEQWNKLALKCSDCGTPMRLFPVNTQPGNQTGDDSKSVWMCMNRECMETIYTPDTIHDIIKAATKAVTNDIASSTSNAGGG